MCGELVEEFDRWVISVPDLDFDESEAVGGKDGQQAIHAETAIICARHEEFAVMPDDLEDLQRARLFFWAQELPDTVKDAELPPSAVLHKWPEILVHRIVREADVDGRHEPSRADGHLLRRR